MNDVVAALADALEPLTLEIPGLQIYPYFNQHPTPPSLDIYPDPGTFLERSAMGVGSWEAVFVVRARVNATDSEAGQQLLLQLMDPRDEPLSVIVALTADGTLGGVVDETEVEQPSGYGEYTDPVGDSTMLGCIWRARVILG